MRSFCARRIVSLLSILLLALANAGCPQLNRQKDYMGNQIMSLDRGLPAIAAAEPSGPAQQAFAHGNMMLIQ
jgi:hypothetical protein